MAGHFKLLPLFLLSLFTFSVYGDLLASIDCGASEGTIDSNLIAWTSDDNLVSNGVTRVVQSTYAISPVMNSLRVFTTRKKNCYSAAVTQGDKVLIRATFHYGNYDRLSSPPSFDLHFDGNFWTTVRTSLSELVMHEVTYVAKRDVVSVCVAQTNRGQFPFISALEVRSLDSDAYSLVDEDRALFLISRIAFGATGTIRFPSDPYDRMWVARVGGTGTVRVTNNALLVNTSTSNNPPSGIFRNAITVGSTTTSLLLGTISPSDTPVYVNLYFTEVRRLDSTETRSFRVYQSSDGSALSSVTITPPYGGVHEFSVSNYTVGSVSDIFLRATIGSDLPPLISAIEAFNISRVLTDGTDSNDVEALALLQSTFDVLDEWSGDPCLPAPYSWDWLNCSYGATPRITALYLDSFELSGSLPDISAMDALTIVNLHNNSLTGAIPSFLGALPNLQQLNLANNRFSGAIPTSLSKNNKLKLTVTGNPSLCASGKSCSTSRGSSDSSPDGGKKKNNLPIILGVAIPAFFLIWVVVGVFIILRRRSTPANTNMSVVTGHTGGGEPGNNGGGVNGISNGWQQTTVNDQTKNVAQQSYGSPSPLLHSSGD